MMDFQSKSIDNIVVITLTGRFDTLTSPKVQSWLEDVSKNQPAQIVVNLSGVNFIDSTALSTLVTGMKRVRQAGGDMRLCKLQHSVRMIFELTRLDKAFEIYPGEEETIRSFNVS